jgi:hypothetical protein
MLPKTMCPLVWSDFGEGTVKVLKVPMEEASQHK